MKVHFIKKNPVVGHGFCLNKPMAMSEFVINENEQAHIFLRP
jgi:hypothetical protein